MFEFCYNSNENDVTERIVYRMFFSGWNFMSSPTCTLNLKKPLKPSKT